MSGKEYYNFLVLGAEATGKTCLCSCFTRGVFLEHHAPTIDDEYKKSITYGNEVDLTIADLGGWHADSVDQDCLQRIKWAQGVVLVYDITNPNSLQVLSDIKAKVDQVKDIKATDEFKLPTIVVGTKADLEEHRAVTGSELKKWADEHGVSYYTEVGLSREAFAAKEVFMRLIGELRAQEQAKKDARAAPKTPENGEKRKSLMSPRSLLSPRKRGQTVSTVQQETKSPEAEAEAGATAAPAGEAAVNNNQEEEREKEREKEKEKEKEREMKREQKEKEKETKKLLKEQKAKEKEEKERQKREQKDRQKAEKVMEKEKKEQERLEKEKEKLEKKEQQAQAKQSELEASAASQAAEAAAAPVVVIAPSDSLEMPAVTVTTAENETVPGSDTAETLAQPDGVGEGSSEQGLQSPAAKNASEGETKEKEKKERRKRRETIAALLSPRRHSVSSSAKESGSVIAHDNDNDQRSISDDIEVVHEGLVSPRGKGAETMRDNKKKSRLTLKRFRRSEVFHKPMGGRSMSEEDGVGSTITPQVQFLRVTKPLDALSEHYKMSPIGSESPVMSADAETTATPVSHPHLALHVAPSSSPALLPSQMSPRMRSPSFRNAPIKPLPTTPLGQHPPPTRQPLPALPSMAASSHTAPMPAIEVVSEPVASPGAVTFDFPNLEDLPIFQDLFPPPTHLGPPPLPPAQGDASTSAASGGAVELEGEHTPVRPPRPARLQGARSPPPISE